MQNFERYAFYLMLAGLALCILGYLGALLAAFRVKRGWGFGILIFPPAVVAFCIKHAPKVPIPTILLLIGGLFIAAPFAANAASPLFIDLGPLKQTVDGELHVTLTGWDRKPDEYSAAIRSVPEATVLQMANPDVTDDTLKDLRSLQNLKELDLNNSQVTDAGLESLAKLPKLEILRLSRTRISDEGFQQHLAEKNSLNELDLRNTAVKSSTVRAWKAAKPGRKALN